ncbi:glycosyltransferase family 4 protein [Rubrivirga sp. IMCC43871]|uniref:glycosyltransferase family 4 protein n=1 Tax=Rubrivirga sp. IMCC43871 TaxID=3391575 RepID=UPI00398FE7A4
MRIYLHDYGGHAFLVGLARELARRGHAVRYGFSATNEAPQGELAPRADDPPTLSLDPVVTTPVDKRARSLAGLVRRRQAEARFGKAAAEHVRRWDAEVVIGANASLDVIAPLMAAAHGQGAAFVNWLQDVHSVGTRAVLARKLGVAGDLLGRAFEAREGRLLRGADAVLAITDAFRPLLARWRVRPERVSVIENWAPLADLPQRPRDNAWARAHGLAERPVVLYSGTLGMKHDPAGLAHLAERLAHAAPDARLVVVSSGEGADWLATAQRERGLANVVLLPFQPFEVFPDVLGSADVFVAVLEPEASAVSVPSKVLAYVCAGRPAVLSVPPDNLAARIVVRERAGTVVPPGDADALADAVLAFLADDAERGRAGTAGRTYAERAFDLGAIAHRFEAVLADAVAARG